MFASWNPDEREREVRLQLYHEGLYPLPYEVEAYERNPVVKTRRQTPFLPSSYYRVGKSPAEEGEDPTEKDLPKDGYNTTTFCQTVLTNDQPS